MSPSTLRGVSLLVVDAEALDGRLDDLLLIRLVVDDEVCVALAADLQGFDVAAQHAHAERVKGADERLGTEAPDQLMHALAISAAALLVKVTARIGPAARSDASTR